MKAIKQVYVALSGGVDSAVAAVRLLDAGYRVTGIYMETWRDPHAKPFDAPKPKPAVLAAAAAEALGVPFIALDVRERFFQVIVRDFIQQYLDGKTPNPCLFCNPQVKWGVLQDYALAQGADYFATGHYARLKPTNNARIQLLRGVDRLKDQSYVLAMLNQQQLCRSLLPLGDLTKAEVRKIAASLNLPVSNDEESQDLCFLPDGDYRGFLQRYAPESASPGKIINLSGEVLGEHQGLAFYTIGQRKGIRIASTEPYYVIGKESESNRLIVGFADETGNRELLATGANWISGIPPSDGEQCHAMIRYRSNPALVTVKSVSEHEFRLEFNQPLRGITSGQVAVLYQGEVCLGGGTIKRAW
ncbi:MAG: tRNA 2-thiouridine(34) synthase MnmA [Chloroflexi bacterium]|jgi:tRNA-specific 2-thiouridylase|nr:tRNA 2-thiouridine(34) synthase MnmA [Chloroflexota bacterium]